MAESDERIAGLLEKLKSSDQETKVDALLKLETEFQAGVKPAEPDEVIQALKTTLRIPNQHIYTASLHTIASFLPVLMPPLEDDLSTPTAHEVILFRHALIAFLAPGGIIDRLGDAREKSREGAKEACVTAGLAAFKCSPHTHATSQVYSGRGGKGPETPLAMYERVLREQGFGSKSARVREQTILSLAQLRERNTHFPLRPFLHHLVDTLEDSDGGVRDVARQSVVEMFTAPSVSDGARADLKKEMTKKGVRKGIVEGILSQLLSKGSGNMIAGGSANNLVADAPSDEPSTSAPPTGPSGLGSRKPTATSFASSSGRMASMSSSVTNDAPEGAPAETVINPVYIASSRDLEAEFHSMFPPFEGKETEHNWQLRDRAVSRVRGMLKGEVHLRYTDVFMDGLRGGFMTNTLKTLASLRTIVATNTCALYVDLAHALKGAYDPFSELTLVPLFRMGSLTKKIVAQETQNTAKEILINVSPHPRLVLPLLWAGVQDKNVSMRQYALGHIRTVLENTDTRVRGLIEATGGAEVLERSFKRALGDPNAAVRETARSIFWIFDSVWKDRAQAIAASLDANARKQLERAAPSGQMSLPPSTTTIQVEKKSSVAAAIAASRAKARQIAAAPPTLRHAATSHASNMASQARRPDSPSSPTSINTRGLPVTPPASAKRMSGFQRSITSPVAPSQPKSPTSLASKSNTSLSPPSSPGHSPSRRLPTTTRSAVSPSSPSVPLRSPSSSNVPLKSPSPSNAPLRSPSSSNAPLKFPPPSNAPLKSPSSSSAPHKSPSPSNAPLKSPGLRSSLSVRSASPPVHSSSTAQVKRASGVFSSPRRPTPSPIPAVNDTLTLSPHPSDDESLMRVRAPNSSAGGSNESLPLASFSDAYTSTPPGIAAETALLTRSTNPVRVPGPVVEDALRARAEQAESAAQRLLEELVEDETVQNIILPPELVCSSTTAKTSSGGVTPRPQKTNGIFSVPVDKAPPRTPVNKLSDALRNSAAFQDSPAYRPGSHSLVEKLKDNRKESSWWLKRVALLQQNTAPPVDEASQADDLRKRIAALEKGSAEIADLQQLAIICSQNPAAEQEESSLGLNPQSAGIWDNGIQTYHLLAGLSKFLTCDKSEEVLEYGLIVLWEILERQQSYLEGRESELLSLLFRLRYTNAQTVAEASNTIRDALTSRIDPVYGLTTIHTSLRKFLAEPIPSNGTAETRALSHAFGLLAIGKAILRLPPEILEDELPRLQLTLSQGLNDSQLLVREAAAAAITAAQLVLRDETYLFTMLASLSEEKKNLLTYLFDKHGARGAVEGVSTGSQGGLDRLEKEMRRLDSRTSTPIRKP